MNFRGAEAEDRHCQGLAAEPEFIVCDEPISALDVSIQAQVINILEELQERFGFTYLFISHDLSHGTPYFFQVGVMYMGNLVEYAPVNELYEHMLHPYTRSLLSRCALWRIPFRPENSSGSCWKGMCLRP